MRAQVVALLLVAAGALHAQDRCAHAGRDALIGAGIGATVVLAVTIPVPSSHEPGPRRITSTRALMETWMGGWGAAIGSTLATGRSRECVEFRAHRDAAGRCGSAARTGALRGAVGGGVQGFLLSPILALPWILPHRPGNTRLVNLDHMMGLITAGGVVLGAPVGAIRAANECHRS